jgi:hypothetical protein
MTTRVDDPTFAALPRVLQRRIDNAFRRAVGKTPSRKRRKLDDDGFYDQTASAGFIPDDSTGGGFIPSDPDTLEGGFVSDEKDDDGGFIPEPSPPHAGPSTSTTSADHEPRAQGGDGSLDSDAHIPLSLIPTALQILDLPPDDEHVLLVFKNAASGWSSSPASARRPYRTAGLTEEVVSLRDWRAVCSVLLEPDVQGGGVQDEDDGMNQERDVRMLDEFAEDSEGSSEEYVESDPGGESDDQYPDDNYSDTPAKQYTRSARKRNTRANRGSYESEDVEMQKNRPLTVRQKEASRQAFAMFLPSSTDGDPEKRRITISDLVRVSKELNEKITYDQVRKYPLDLSGR